MAVKLNIDKEYNIKIEPIEKWEEVDNKTTFTCFTKAKKHAKELIKKDINNLKDKLYHLNQMKNEY